MKSHKIKKRKKIMINHVRMEQKRIRKSAAAAEKKLLVWLLLPSAHSAPKFLETLRIAVGQERLREVILCIV